MAPPAFLVAISFATYEENLRGLIHGLKFDGILPLRRQLGRWLGMAIARLGDDCPNDLIVVPVPLHASKLRERGFNQAVALASEAIRYLRRNEPRRTLQLAENCLQRHIATKSQAALTPRQRRLNLRGAFFVPDPDMVRGRHILLVDDIYTSGATARACSRVLLDAGASSVRVATLARAQRRRPAPLTRTGKYFRVDSPSTTGTEIRLVANIQASPVGNA